MARPLTYRNRQVLGIGVVITVAVLGFALKQRFTRNAIKEQHSAPRPASSRDNDPETIAAAVTPIVSVPLPVRPRRNGPLFMPVPEGDTGVQFTNVIDDDNLWSGDYRTTLNGSLGSGTCAGDTDNDGKVDIYLVSREGPNKLFRQTGDFLFEDVTETAGVDGGDGLSAGATFIDIDNDGDLDLYLCRYDAPNVLYVNQGDGTFVDRSEPSGLDFHGASVMAAPSDFDRDGDLDLYLVTNLLFLPDHVMRRARSQVRVVGNRPVVPKHLEELVYFYPHDDGSGRINFKAMKAGQRDHLFRNNGDGTFSDVSDEAGLDGCFRGHCVTWWDYNDDNWPDLYVSNDFFDADQLFRNNGNGTFSDVTRFVLPHTPWFSMGSDFADVNNDGRFDLMATDMSSTTHFKQKLNMAGLSNTRWFLESAEPRQYMRNALYLNTGTTRAMEVAFLAGLESTNWTWAVKFCDMDNDGRTDVFFTNGMIRNVMDADLQRQGARIGAQESRSSMGELLRMSEPLLEENLAYRNSGGLTFVDVGKEWGLAHRGFSCSAAFADLDRDGDMDLIVNNYNEPVSLYRNQCDQGHRILLCLKGTQNNLYGVGAVARIKTMSGIQAKTLRLGRGYMSSEEPLLHFGLGDDEQITSLSVRWPCGHVQEFHELAADRLYTITEPTGDAPTATPSSNRSRSLYRNVTTEVGLKFRHTERRFDDYTDQPLLPYQLSRLGPGLAWGDVDQDGDDDLLIGGAAGQGGALFMNEDGGRKLVRRDGPWAAHKECEDMAVLWIDADGDTDLDLFVASGGVEAEHDDHLLRDRLYLNDGQANFKIAPNGFLPDLRDSSGAATAADFDRDGDLDLFVGGRVVPGKYPLAPRSTLLRNENGKFIDVTESVAPRLRNAGLITSALWSDVDDDGLVDLLVTLEWGPVRFFRNTGEKLVDRTDEAGLAKHRGWWNGIAGGDLDGDGDIDYAVSNVGRNTKYRASPSHPAVLYYGDLDGQGREHLVEAFYEHDRLFPVRGFSNSFGAMPFIAEQFPTYRAFAAADLEAIYTRESLEKARRFEADFLDNAVLVNLGKGRFEVRPLPRWVQASPGFGLAVTDFDGDGANDVCVVQNFYAPQPETGRMDGGVGALLLNDGAGELTPLDPTESGLLVPGDAKGLATTDLDRDGWPDFAVTQNDQPALVFRHRKAQQHHPLAIRLQGNAGNPTAVGARVQVRFAGGSQQSAEVYAGSGYLSQSAPILFFGKGVTTGDASVNIRWPDGSQSTHSVEASERYVVLTKPAAT